MSAVWEQSHLLASVTGPVHTVTNSYESGRDAMTSKTNAAASGTVSRFGARYDALGRRIETSRSGSAFAQNFVSGYEYDLLGQLISVLRTELSSGDGLEMIGVETDDNPLAPQAGLLQDASGGHGPMSTPLESPLQSPLLPSTSFTERDARFEGSTPGAPDQKLEEESFVFLYDGIGNRLTAQKGTDTITYTPNALNQHTSIDGIEPVYDADGNLFSDGKNRYHWDAENRLTLVEPLVPSEGSKRLEFKYDYIGRRVSKQVWTHTGGSLTDDSTTAFVCDGWNLIEEVSTSSQTASINHYTWGLDLSLSLQGAGGVGGLLALSHVEGLASPSTFHCTFDLNGNVSELLDSTGFIAAHYEYGPFGELLVENYEAGLGTAVASFRFSTKYYDAELKTLYYGFRYYDPTTGCWLNRDPIEESGGLNLYGFVGNDAVNKSDSIGLFDWSEIDSIERWLDGIEHGQGPLTNRIDVNLGIVVFSPTMGLSGSLAFYMPIYLFVGAFIKVDCETRMGLCCSVSGKKKGYQETKCAISLGVYTGTFGFKPRIGETLVEDLKICPGETKTGVFGWGDGWVWDGKAFTVGIRVSYFSGSCSFCKGKWKCKGGVTHGGKPTSLRLTFAGSSSVRRTVVY